MKVFWVLLFIIISSSMSLAATVSIQDMENKTVYTNVSDDIDVSFQISNTFNETRNVTFMLNSPSPMEIDNDEAQHNETFELDPLANKAVNIEFDSEVVGNFRVDYAVDDGNNVSSDYFFVQVGNTTDIQYIGIALEYPGFVLSTDSNDEQVVEDLIIQCSRIEVDFSRVTLNLTGFKKQYVKCERDSVWLDVKNMPTFRQKAYLKFYSILPDYVIYFNDSECGYRECEFESYASRRLVFHVDEFDGEYRVDSKEFDDVIIPRAVNITPVVVTVVDNITENVTAIENISETLVLEPEPEPVVVQQEVVEMMPYNSEEIINTTTIVFPNYEPVFGQEDEAKVYLVDTMAKNPKTLLISSSILGLVSMILSCGALFYYIKGIKGRGVGE